MANDAADPDREPDIAMPAPARGVVTSFDVAAAAGVSQSTVSRALRNLDSVSRETRDRVMDAATQLGYLPDLRAARLRQATTGCIALVILVPTGVARGALNPFYYDLVAAIEAAAMRQGRRILLSFQESVGFDAEFEQRREADGMIVIGSATHVEGWRHFTEAAAQGRQIVAWGSPHDDLPTVRADNQDGARQAIEHLIAIGRRRIAFAGPGWQQHAAYAERRDGYLAALAAHDLSPIDISIDVEGDREQQGAGAIEWLAREAADADAVFAASDLVALGALRALRVAGRRVPQDVAVIGFDGIQGVRHCDPALTTIAQDVEAAGTALVDALLQRLSGVPHSQQRVPVHLTIRAST
ncbi:LacI family DNA-binding transcriptional regulator [Sphingomonas sp.]|uniref:LacI family DNA-binding transcriptional regulator n=1 Tax=Sphingomonas sp. TaxID=28214 RepID=UPI002BE2F8CC|nr:LacI family DNA-binding transcriptional regulator [Sphingomonas sp.]HTG38751.1 LacI family DNA-binding transcriptional regulator [Sphingomonas sp.]